MDGGVLLLSCHTGGMRDRFPAGKINFRAGKHTYAKVSRTISGRVPTRMGGPQVPAPLDV
jgi:hypothetical protein